MRNLLAALGLLLSAHAAAIELALEENKATRGSVGTVDMRRVFKAYPETQRAKQAFEELLRQAEEQLALKKAALLRLRHDLSDLKAQRDLLSRTPLVVTPSPAPAPAPKPSAPALQLPGMSTTTAAVLPPGEPPAPAVSTAPAAAASVSTAPAVPALTEFDAKILLKSEEVAAKDAEYKAAQAATEQNLLDLESRKTEVLLGQIHRAIQDVAREEKVSVVVDKSSVLYGHDAVDLTEKVLKRLKGS